MYYYILILFGGLVDLRFGECTLTWDLTYYSENKTGYTWNDADTICKANGLVLAVVDSEEKWEMVVSLITGGNRYTAEKDVYIGLNFNPSINNFTWSTGVQASWTKWYQNEPYYTDTRHCVRLDVYAEYYFRTTDCSYRHHFVCSRETEETTTTTKQTYTSSTGIKMDMVIGLSVGFGMFFGIIILICLLCRCCCNFTEKKYAADRINVPRRTKPTKTEAISQYEIFMNQTEGIDYNRMKFESRNQHHDDYVTDDETPSNVIEVTSKGHTTHYNDMDDVGTSHSPTASYPYTFM